MKKTTPETTKTKPNGIDTAAPHLMQMLKLASVRPAAANPRKRFDPAAHAELTESVKEHGVIQPILVRYLPPQFTLHEPDLTCNQWQLLDRAGQVAHTGTENNVRMLAGQDGLAGWFEIVYGERRFRAATAAGLPLIPAIVRELTDDQARILRLIENLQRLDMTILEEAEEYHDLVASGKFTADSLAAEIKMSRSHVYLRLKIATLPAALKALVSEGKLTPLIAELVAKVPGERLQAKAAEEILAGFNHGYNPDREPMSYRQAKDHIEDNYTLDLKGAPWNPKDAELWPPAGSCAACPKRSGNAKELFPDLKNPNVCTDPECFSRKKEEFVRRAADQLASTGVEVLHLKDKERRRLFNGGTELSWLGGSGFLHPSALTEQAANGRTLKQMLGKDVPASVAVIGPDGTAHLLLRDKDVREALEKKGINPAAEEERKQKRSAAERARWKEAGERREVMAERLLPDVIAKLEKRDEPLAFARLLCLVMGKVLWVERNEAMERRAGAAWNDKNWQKNVETMRLPELRGLMVEMIIRDEDEGGPVDYRGEWSETFRAACEFAGIDLKAREKEETRLPKEGEQLPLPEGMKEAVDGAGSTEVITLGKIRKPFAWRGRLWVETGGSSGGGSPARHNIMQVVPSADYKNQKFTYEEKLAGECDKAMGYEGIMVKSGSEEYVLTAPQFEFVEPKPEGKAGAQKRMAEVIKNQKTMAKGRK